MTPLSHHDIMKHSADLTRMGLRVDLANSNRTVRTIAYRPIEVQLAGMRAQVAYVLFVHTSGCALERAVLHPNGAIGIARAHGKHPGVLYQALNNVPIDKHWQLVNDSLLTISFTVETESHAATDWLDHCDIEQIHVLGQGWRMVIDGTVAGGMPAHAFLWLSEADDSPAPDDLPRTLASERTYTQQSASAKLLHSFSQSAASPGLGSNRLPASTDALYRLPDDILAVLGSYWLPLSDRQYHRRSELRLPRKRGQSRNRKLIDRITQATEHLDAVLWEAPGAYHCTYEHSRRRVFLRRLQPFGFFVAILLVMPLMYFAVRQWGVAMHPLSLGITPLLMVIIMALSTRDVPTMQWPPWPRVLTHDHWFTRRNAD